MNGDFRVGEFLIQPELNTITGAGKTAHVEPKAMHVLVCLAEHAGDVLAKEKLIQLVWADTFVTDDVLTRSISELRKVFDDDAKEPRVIQTIPRRGYRLIAPVSYDEAKRKQTDIPAPVPPNKLGSFFWLAMIVIGLAILGLSAWYLRRLITKPVPPQPTLTAIPLTTDPGFEGTPSLSPDGNQVAYASAGPDSDNFDIYVKQIGGGPTPRRLTSDPATDEFPAWSPDGRSIAFIRDRSDKLEVLLIPSEGGPERKIADIAPDTTTGIFSWVPPYLSWSHDSKYLVTSDRAASGEPLSLFVFSIATGEKRRLTTPPAKTFGDGNPAISPDGRTLAFVRIVSAGSPQLFVLRLSEDYQSTAEPRRLDISPPWVVSPAWTADSREIICEAGNAPWANVTSVRLWRIAVSGSEGSQPLPSVGEEFNGQPTISRQGNRLVYTHWTANSDIWRIELVHNGTAAPAGKLIASTRWDGQPQYSPDGSKIVFDSGRSGHNEIWVSDANGANPVQLTSLESSAGSPFWFPDGKRIVFDSTKEGHTEIYVMDISTQVPRRLTNEASDDVWPSVSHDGKWIYFVSMRTGRFEVWRMPAEGGDAVQVTHEGGVSLPLESVDGSVVYYYKDQGVWKVSVFGGEESRVIGPIDGTGQFAVTTAGIYYIEIGTHLYVGSKDNSLKFFSFAKGTTEKVADVNLNPQVGFSVSPDGRYAVFDQIDPFVCDLMLVENFR
jgi:Tol biopolymer transport system component/DNA-binding winged helix-turn-helix (wHTH) protein